MDSKLSWGAKRKSHKKKFLREDRNVNTNELANMRVPEELFVVLVQSLSHVQLFESLWTTAQQASLSFTIFQSLLKLLFIESVMPSNSLILSSPSPPALNLSQHRGLFQWVSSSHQVAKVLEFQPQHQSFQWLTKTIKKKKKCKKKKWLSEETLQIAEKRRKAKGKGEKDRYTHLNAELQRKARREKKAFLSDECKKNRGKQ